jgi:hypothetical protein
LPLIDIEDVKPGDFGELTLSYHLCTNDGFVWLQADDVGSAENGYTEPERKDEDETGDADGDGQDDTTELLDEIQTTWWYDTDGDNVLDSGAEGGGEGGQADVVVVFDRSGSMGFEAGKLQSAKDGAKALVDAAGSGVNLGLVPFNTTASVTEPLGSPRSEIKTTIDGLTASGGTDIAEAINDAQAEIDANGRAGVPNFIVLLTNGVSSPGPAGSAADTAKAAGTTIYGIAYGSGADEALIEEVSSPPKNDDGDIDDVDEFAFVADQTDIENVFGDIGGGITGVGEQVFFRGTLREALALLTDGKGLLLDADPSTADVDPFMGSMTNYVGFAWYLPVNHANEIQTDSVSFDLGFYTEQARHNDPTMGNT